MKIAIDTTALYTTNAGTSTYIRELLRCIKSQIEVHEICFNPKYSRENKILRKIDTIKRDVFWLQNKLPELAQEKKSQLLHCPAMVGPHHCKIPVVLTIHDLYIRRNGQAFPFWLRTMMKYTFPKVIDNAVAFVAVSNFTKKEFLEYFQNIPENKVRVTWEGVNKIFKIIDKCTLKGTKIKYKLDRPYLLSVSTIEPRKNLKRLLIAYANSNIKNDYDLILAGSYGWKSRELYHLIDKLKIGNHVKFIGYVPTSELPSIYNLAEAFIYPSLYEGFGLPPLEAMACGCPVITSNTSSMPEVVGSAAITVDPYNTEAISYAISNLLADSTKMAHLQKAGHERAKTFTWEKCSQDTIKIYKDVINENV
jgi:glycosyltransferase involved in cell wall biosynthesis